MSDCLKLSVIVASYEHILSFPFNELLWETKILYGKKRVHIIVIQNFSEPEDLSAYDGLEFRLKGDGRRYKVIVRTSPDWDALGYTGGIDTEKGKWQSVVKI